MIKTFLSVFPQWPGSSTASAVLNVTANGSTVAYHQFGSYDQAILTVEVTAVTGTSPTLDLFVDEYNKGTGSWTQIDKFKQLTTTTGASPVRRMLNCRSAPPSYPGSGDGAVADGTLNPFGEALRLRWTVGGTTPNFTFSCSAVLSTQDS